MATWGHCTLRNEGTPAGEWGEGEVGCQAKLKLRKEPPLERMKSFLYCKAELTRTQLPPKVRRQVS